MNIESSKDSRLFKNYIYSFAYHLFTIVTPLVTTPYISRVLGAENIGIYSYVESICLYFIVMGNMGFPLLGQREIAYCANDVEKRSQKFAEIMAGKIAFLVLSLGLYLSFVTFFAHDNKVIFLSYSVGIIADIINVGWFYQGIEDFRTTIARNFLIKITSIVLIFVFVKTENDLLNYSLLINFANLFGNLLVAIAIKRKVTFKHISVNIIKILKLIKPALILAIPFYITSVYAVLDKTMLGALCDNYSEVGFYEQSQKIVTFALSIVTSIGVVFMPRIANEVAEDNGNAIRKYLNRGLEIILLLSSPIMFGLLCVGDMIVPWFFGSGFERVGGLISIFSSLALAMGLSNFIGNQYLVALKKERLLSLSIAIGVVINLGLNILLIPLYASYGAAIATVVSEFCKLVFLIVCIRNAVDIKKIAKKSVKYLSLSAIMFGCGFLMKQNVLFEYTLLNTIVIILICSTIYLGALFATKDNIVLTLFSAIHSRFKKNRSNKNG